MGTGSYRYARDHWGSGIQSPPGWPPLLLVALDGGRWADVGRVRVRASLAQGAALAKQVPTLVEADLEGVQASMAVVAQALTRTAFKQLVLLGDEFLDVLEQLRVGHWSAFQEGRWLIGAEADAPVGCIAERLVGRLAASTEGSARRFAIDFPVGAPELEVAAERERPIRDRPDRGGGGRRFVLAAVEAMKLERA